MSEQKTERSSTKSFSEYAHELIANAVMLAFIFLPYLIILDHQINSDWMRFFSLLIIFIIASIISLVVNKLIVRQGHIAILFTAVFICSWSFFWLLFETESVNSLSVFMIMFYLLFWAAFFGIVAIALSFLEQRIRKFKRINSITIFSVLLLLAAFLLISSDNGYLLIKGPTNVLGKPYPLDYSNLQNKVIERLEEGEKVNVLIRREKKAYLYYKVQLNDGRTGYVINGSFDFHGWYGREDFINEE